MAINYASKASPKVVEAFSHESFVEPIFNNDYDWTGVATVRVYSVDDLPLNDYNATLTSGSRFGALTELGDTYQELTVTEDKAFNGAIDKRNNTSTLMIKAAGKVTARETRNVVVPYMDKKTFKKIAQGNGVTGFGTTGGGHIEYGVSMTKTNAVSTIMGAGAFLSNKLVPKKGRYCFIGETTALNVKLADQIFGTGATLQNAAGQILRMGEIGQIDQTRIICVPDDYLPADVLFILVAQGCVVRPKKIETLRIIEDHPDIDGHVVQGRYLWDCFVLKGKADGIYVAKSTAAAGTASITLGKSSLSLTVGTADSSTSLSLSHCSNATYYSDDDSVAVAETASGYVKVTPKKAGSCIITVKASPDAGYNVPAAQTIAVTAS